MPKISVIVLTRNEERYIEKCLSSIFCSNLSKDVFEVIVVDSNSDDGTLDILKDYPVKVIHFDKPHLFSPPASLYIGFKHAVGEFLFILGGDMTLDSEWLMFAREKMEQDSNLGMVAGNRPDLFKKDGQNILETAHSVEYGRNKIITGPFMITKKFFQEQNPIDPFMCGSEESYCSLVALTNNYNTERFDKDMIVHLGTDKVANNFNLRYHIGMGQKLRRLLFKTNPKLLFHNDFIQICLFTLFMLNFIVFLFGLRTFLVYNDIFLIKTFLAFNSLIFLGKYSKSLSISKSFQTLLFFYIKSYFFFKGLLLSVKKINTFPLKFKISKYGD